MSKPNVSQAQGSNKTYSKSTTKLSLSTSKKRSGAQVGFTPPSSRNIIQYSSFQISKNASSSILINNIVESKYIYDRIMSENTLDTNPRVITKSKYSFLNQQFQKGAFKIAVIKVSSKRALTEQEFKDHIVQTPANLNNPNAGTILDKIHRLKQAKQYQYEKCLHFKSKLHLKKKEFVRLKTEKEIRQGLIRQITKPYRFEFNRTKEKVTKEIEVNMFNCLDGIMQSQQVQNPSQPEPTKKINLIASKIKQPSWKINTMISD